MFGAGDKIAHIKHKTQGSTRLSARFGLKIRANARVCEKTVSGTACVSNYH
jgi:hypothetical protein